MEEQRVSLSPVTNLSSGRSLPRQYTIDQILGNPPRDTKDPSKLHTFQQHLNVGSWKAQSDKDFIHCILYESCQAADHANCQLHVKLYDCTRLSFYWADKTFSFEKKKIFMKMYLVIWWFLIQSGLLLILPIYWGSLWMVLDCPDRQAWLESASKISDFQNVLQIFQSFCFL